MSFIFGVIIGFVIGSLILAKFPSIGVKIIDMIKGIFKKKV